tara:strand:+ start:11306 stop:11893 length:588 start_codon:yes stop_codon:yes gene_type:complete
MNEQFKNEIEESLLKERLYRFYNKYKLLLISISMMILIILLSFPTYEEYIIRKNSKILEKYSEAILYLDSQEHSKGINYLTELLTSSNEKIKILSATKLLEIYLQQKKFVDSLNVIDTVLEDKKISDDSKKLFKIKKVLLKFDNISENELLELLEPNKTNVSFQTISLLLLLDFYSMKNQTDKIKEVEMKLKELQ